MSVVARVGLFALLVSSGLGCISQQSDARVPRAIAAPEQEGAPAAMQPASLVAARQPTAPGSDAASDEVTPGPCPIRAVGARVGVEHLDDGGALVLTTRGDVVGLRAQLKGAKLRPTGAAAARAVRRLDNVERGMRVVFTAASPSDASNVQRELDTYARQLAKRCAMALVEPGSDDDASTSESSSAESDETPAADDASTLAPSVPDDGDSPEPEPKPDPADEAKDEDESEQKSEEPAADPTDDPGSEDGSDDDDPDDQEPPVDGDGDDDEELPDVEPESGAHHTS